MPESGGDADSAGTSGRRAAALDGLLQRLGQGGEGAIAYERLRFRLVTYFRLRFPAEAETLADDAIDRLARRIDEGIPVVNPAAYALGIARLIVLEAGARHRKERDALREVQIEAQTREHDSEPDAAVAALRACLDRIGAEAAAFILEYHAVDGPGGRGVRREAMAQRLGLTLNALRNRALRIRLGLERCIGARLQAELRGPGASRDEAAKLHTSDIMPAGATKS